MSMSGFDETKYMLGTLCKYEHRHEGTTQSLRYLYRGKVTACVMCVRARVKKWGKDNLERDRKAQSRSRDRTRDSRLERRRSRYHAGKDERDSKANEKAAKVALERQIFAQEVCKLNEEYGVDTSLYTLRTLCKRKHEYLDSGLSLATGKDIFKGSCVECRRQSRAKGMAGMNYRGRKLAANSIPFSKSQLQKRLIEFGGCCAYCGIQLRRDFKDCKRGDYLNWEHMIPLVKGGVHGLSNLVPSCKSCNGAKVDKDVFEWYLEANPKPHFFCPRRAEMIVRVLQSSNPMEQSSSVTSSLLDVDEVLK